MKVCTCGIVMNDLVCPKHGRWAWEDETGSIHQLLRPAQAACSECGKYPCECDSGFDEKS